MVKDTQGWSPREGGIAERMERRGQNRMGRRENRIEGRGRREEKGEKGEEDRENRTERREWGAG